MKKLVLTLLATFSITGFCGAKNLYVNSQEYEVDTLVYKHQIGPGTTYAYYRLPARPMEIHVLEIDLNNPYITMEVCNGGDAAVACERPSSMYARHDSPGHDMVAATNGDYYTTTNGSVGISRMGLFGAGECIFNPTGQSLFVVDKQGTPWCDYVNFAGTVTHNGSSIRLHTVNQLKLEWQPDTYDNQLSLFTNAFGTKLHDTTTGGSVAVIRPKAGSATYPSNTDLTLVVESVQANPGGLAIPEDAAVLYGVGTSSDYLNSLKAGDEVTIFLGTSLPKYPDVTAIREAIGGSGHIILREGQLMNIGDPALHPRTFMGTSKDRKTIYSVIIDGRYSGSAGIDLDDEGRVLQWLGAWEGINLDGGGSSCIVVNGSIRNHNSDGSERAVGNGVLYYSTAPVDDNISSIAFEPREYKIPISANFYPVVFGYNKYGVLKSENVSDVTFSCDPEIGTIDENGMFVAAGNMAQGNLYADFGGIKCSVAVKVIHSDLNLDYDTYIIDSRRDYDIQMSATIGRYQYPVDANSVTWTVADPSVCKVINGRLHGLSNGSTTITGTSENFTGTINVSTENVDGNSIPYLRPVDPEIWTLKQTGGTGITMEADGEGFNLNFTGGGSTRTPSITMTPSTEISTYGLPSGVEMDINPGDIAVSTIAISYTDNHGEHGTFTINKSQLNKNELNTIVAPLDLIVDSKDNTVFPIKFSTIRISTGTSTKGAECSVKVPRFVFTYPEIGGVESISDNEYGKLELSAYSVVRGEKVFVTSDSDFTVYGIGGSAVLTSRDEIDTASFAPGLYIVKSVDASAKLIVK